MDKVNIEKLNESWVRIEGPEHFCRALSDHFTFQIEKNIEHMRRNNPRLRYWDGKVRMYKSKTKTLPYGLLNQALDWIYANNQLEISWVRTKPHVPQTIDDELFARLVLQAQKNDPKFVFAQDQYDAVKHCLETRRAILVSPTSSGKSFIIFALHQHLKKKMLVIVPTIQLTGQMKRNFEEYGCTNNIHTLFYGQDRNFVLEDGDVVVATWHTLDKMPKEFFEQFEVLIGDEVHEYDAKTSTSIIESCINAYYKIGMTGSLKHSKIHKLALEGLFGPIIQFVTTKELMDQKRVSQLKVNVLVLRYPESDRKAFWKGPHDYESELNFIYEHEKRNQAICSLALGLTRNALIMFRHKRQGLDLYRRLELDSTHNKKLFYVDGDIDLSDRQDLVTYFEQHNDGIGAVSFRTFQRGISINNLFHLIYACPNKSEIATIQSIGRLLRLHLEKDRATLWDFVDDLSLNGNTNAALEHFLARLQEYADAGFEYEIHTIDL